MQGVFQTGTLRSYYAGGQEAPHRPSPQEDHLSLQTLQRPQKKTSTEAARAPPACALAICV